jgi:predicted acetyltransferase
MLRLGLLKARALGIDNALITCHKNNIGSAKVALNNGAVFESEEQIDGEWVQRYWVKIC